MGEGGCDLLVAADGTCVVLLFEVAGRLRGGAVLTLRWRSAAAGRLEPMGREAGPTAELKAELGEVDKGDAVTAETGAVTGVGAGECGRGACGPYAAGWPEVVSMGGRDAGAGPINVVAEVGGESGRDAGLDVPCS